MGVDMFFNVPEHKLPTIYVYHAIRVQTCYYVVPDVSQQVTQVECDADWMGQLKVFLDHGWKLVDIAIDTTALAEGTYIGPAGDWHRVETGNALMDLSLRHDDVHLDVVMVVTLVTVIDHCQGHYATIVYSEQIVPYSYS